MWEILPRKPLNTPSLPTCSAIIRQLTTTTGSEIFHETMQGPWKFKARTKNRTVKGMRHDDCHTATDRIESDVVDNHKWGVRRYSFILSWHGNEYIKDERKFTADVKGWSETKRTGWLTWPTTGMEGPAIGANNWNILELKETCNNKGDYRASSIASRCGQHRFEHTIMIQVKKSSLEVWRQSGGQRIYRACQPTKRPVNPCTLYKCRPDI